MRHSILIRFVLLISLTALIWSCKKEPDLLGLDLIPEGDLLSHEYIDTVSIEAITVRETELNTDELSTTLLGSLNDSVFGRTDASFYTEFRLPTKNVTFGKNPVLDSIFLTMPYKGVYGDQNAVQHVKIYEVFETISYKASYTQSSKLSVGSELIGEATFVPNLIDSIFIDTIKTVPQMKIPMSSDFGNRLLNADTLTLSANSEFRKVFKGIFVTVEGATTPGTGGIMYLNPTSEYSNIYMYYKYLDTKPEIDTMKSDRFEFRLNQTSLDPSDDFNSGRFNHYDHHGYLGADPDLFSQFTGNSASTDQKLYLQAMGGAKIKFKFPYLKDLASKKIAIHEAALIIESADTNTKKYPIPGYIGIRSLDKEGKYKFLIDESVEGSSYLDGLAKNNQYRFRITRYIQNRLLNPDEEDYGLMLLVAGGSLSGNRAVIKGTQAGEGRMRLLIYYTPVQ